MNSICPICHALLNTRCDACGFELPAYVFLNEEDANKWFKENVIPLQEKWNNSKQYKAIICRTCGKELQGDWKGCPYCLTSLNPAFTEEIIDNTTALFTDEAIFAQPVAPKTSQPVPPQSNILPLAVLENMVYIQGGTFIRGISNDEPDRLFKKASQYQKITVSPFYMGKHQVTQEEYQAVIGTNPSYFKGSRLPVEQVSWFSAIEYCNQLSQREGLSLAYTQNTIYEITWNRSANGYRLPTEAEWEYACRAGTTTRYNTGIFITKRQANYKEKYGRTTPVGSFSPNAWGLYDMHGNVYEWCWDSWASKEFEGGDKIDPIDSVFSNYHNGARSGYNVIRGGSWNDFAAGSAFRNAADSDFNRNDIGFRLVRS